MRWFLLPAFSAIALSCVLALVHLQSGPQTHAHRADNVPAAATAISSPAPSPGSMGWQ